MLIKIRKIFCLHLLIVLMNVAAPADGRSKTPAVSQDLGDRIQRIENGLIPNPGIVVKGQPSGKTGIAERMKIYRVPGVSIAVINGYEIEWEEGYGFRESGGIGEVTPDTLFQAASISKPVVAATALYYVEKGILGLDEDVNSRLRS